MKLRLAIITVLCALDVSGTSWGFALAQGNPTAPGGNGDAHHAAPTQAVSPKQKSQAARHIGPQQSRVNNIKPPPPDPCARPLNLPPYSDWRSPC